MLGAWARRRKTSQALALRSRIVLACAEPGASNRSVAVELGVSRDTVRKWRSGFAESRLEGLSDEPRPGRPRTVTDAKIEAVITATLEQEPPGAASVN
ncbi:MAG: helix-turn-helix domain-containing protein [Nocardiopsaceae bacterium]|nr:helix-turn-helix domain-containing protein [Nocardiopsaceae bacterium]